MRSDLSAFGRVAIRAAVSRALVAGAAAGDNQGQARQNSSEAVDSGSFGVFIQGQRVATESITIRQQAGTSPIKSQLKETSAADPASQKSKPARQPFPMPNISAILGCNFFVHPELLVWRSLAAACKPEGSSFQCQQHPGDFGVLVPADRSCTSAGHWWERKKYKLTAVTAISCV